LQAVRPADEVRIKKRQVARRPGRTGRKAASSGGSPTSDGGWGDAMSGVTPD
jgi:hypothetical protein